MPLIAVALFCGGGGYGLAGRCSSDKKSDPSARRRNRTSGGPGCSASPEPTGSRTYGMGEVRASGYQHRAYRAAHRLIGVAGRLRRRIAVPVVASYAVIASRSGRRIHAADGSKRKPYQPYIFSIFASSTPPYAKLIRRVLAFRHHDLSITQIF